MTSPQPFSADDLLAHAAWVRRLARRLVGDEHDAADLAQSAMTSAIERPPPSDRPLKPWFARVVANLARKDRRGTRRRAAREQRYAEVRPPAVPATDQLLAEIDEQKRLAGIVSDLREPYRTVLLLHFYRDQPAAEIARATGTTPATVRSQLKRGLEIVRERVAAVHGGDARRAQSALLLAAGLEPAAPPPIGIESIPAAEVVTAGGLLAMKTGTKVFATIAACAFIATGVYVLTPPDDSTPIRSDGADAIVEGDPFPKHGDQNQAASASDVGDVRSEVKDAEGAADQESSGVPAPEALGPTTFTARVIDEHGEPIAGAAFEVVTKLGRPREFGKARTSGPDGRVTIEVEKGAFFRYMGREHSNTHLSLGAPGHAKTFFVAAAKLGATKDLGDLVLAEGAAVTGRVIDENGLPVAGATVVGVASVSDRAADQAAIVGPEREGGRPTTTTDAAGRFELEGLHVGSAVVWANAERTRWTKSGVLELLAGDVHRGLELVLDPLDDSQIVAGVVVDPDGVPVPRASVRHRVPGGWSEARLRADEDGRFLIPTASDAPFRLVASDPSKQFGDSAEREVKAGETDLRIPLTEWRTLRIQVVDVSDKSPIVDASVISMPVPNRSHFMNSKWHDSNEAGICELTVPGEPFRVNVGHASYEYQQLGPFDPAALPTDEVYVELEKKPMIRGVVLAGDQPVEGAVIDIAESTEGEYRPLYHGVPMRLFDSGGLEQATTDAEGRFELPTNESATRTAVLLVTKEGFALTEHALEGHDPTAAIDGVEIQMNTGGSLVGRVRVGPNRSPASVVVLVSRGDGRPKFTRPDADGNYRFDNLTPGPWRVEDRDVEPEGRSHSVAQGDEHPFRWDCEVRLGETTSHDLDLRWHDGLRVTGRLTFGGRGVSGWSAVIESPEHADRPWACRPGELAADGSFSIEAKPGPATLVLRSPAGASVAWTVSREFVIERNTGPQVFEFATGAVEGSVSDAASTHRLRHDEGPRMFVEATFRPSADGTFHLDQFVAGDASLQSQGETQFGAMWMTRGRVTVVEGETARVQ